MEESYGFGLRGTRLSDYRVAAPLGRRDVNGGVKAVGYNARAIQAERDVLMTVIYNEQEPSNLGMGDTVAAEYGFASGTRVPGHPCIARALHSFIDAAGQVVTSARHISEWERALFVITESCGKPLSTVITERTAPFPVREVLTLASQLVSALAHLQQHGVCHRAVSPDTIYVDASFTTKLTGFASCFDARSASSEGGWKMLYLSRYTHRGDEAVLPPELLSAQAGRGVTLDYEQTDAYSLGLVLHRMLTGHAYPYQHGAQYATEASYLPVTGVSEEVARFVKGLLSANPQQRTSLSDAHHQLTTIMSRTFYAEACRAERFAQLAQQTVEVTARAEEAEADRKLASQQKAALEEELADAQWKLGDLDMLTREVETLGAAKGSLEAKVAELEHTMLTVTNQLQEEQQTREALDILSKTQAAQLDELERKLTEQETIATDRISTLTYLLDNTKQESITRLADLRARNEEIITAVKLNKKDISPDQPPKPVNGGKEKKLRKHKTSPRSSDEEIFRSEKPADVPAPAALPAVARESSSEEEFKAAPKPAPKTTNNTFYSSSESESIQPQGKSKKTHLPSTTESTPKLEPEQKPAAPPPMPKVPRPAISSSSDSESEVPAPKPAAKSSTRTTFESSSDSESEVPAPKPAAKSSTKIAFESSSDSESMAAPVKAPPRPTRTAYLSSDSDEKSASVGDAMDEDPLAAFATTRPETPEEKPAPPVYSSSSDEASVKAVAVSKSKVPQAERSRAFSRYSEGGEENKADSSSDSDFMPVQASRQTPADGRRPTQHISDSESDSDASVDVAELHLEMTRVADEKFGFNVKNMEVTSITAGTPAERCGFTKAMNMILTHINGTAVNVTEDVKKATEGQTKLTFSFREKIGQEIVAEMSSEEEPAKAPLRQRGKSLLVSSSDSDSSDGMFAKPAVKAASPATAGRLRGRSLHMDSSESDESSSDEPAPPVKAAAKPRGRSLIAVSDSSDDSSSEIPVKKAPPPRTRGKSLITDSSDSSSDDMFKSRKPPAKTSSVAKPRSKSLIMDSSSDDSEPLARAKPAAARVTVSDSDSSSDEPIARKKVTKVVPKTGKARSKSMFESDSSESEAPARPKPTAKRSTVTSKKMPASMFADSSSSD